MQETLDYEVKSDLVTARRRKEEADDYRYFPEPDLVPLDPPTELVERLRTEVPELPGSRIRRFEREYELSYYDAEVLNGSAALAHLYEQVALDGVDAKAASNVLMNDFVATGIDPAAVDGDRAREAHRRPWDDPARDVHPCPRRERRSRVPRGDVSRRLARRGHRRARAARRCASSRTILDRLRTYKGGKEGLLGFFVGQVMKETQGKADPKVVNELLRAKLQG